MDYNNWSQALDFEPLMRKKARLATAAPLGSDERSDSRPLKSMSTFIQSAMTHSASEREAGEIKKKRERGKRRQIEVWERKIGSAEWDRMVEEVKCIDAQPGGVASSNESADISSFTDDSSIESCHSPEIQRRNDIIVDCEDSSDGIEPRPLAHDSESESDMSLFLSRARRTEGQKVDSPVGMGFLDPQTSTPLSETKVITEDIDSRLSSDEEVETQESPVSAVTEEYLIIESPLSSPELSHTQLKTTDWLKHVSSHPDHSNVNETMKTPVDSTKRGKGRKFVSGGLAEQLQRIIHREKSEIAFWEHRSVSQEKQDSSGCLLVRVLSIVNCCSTVLAKVKVHQHFVDDSQINLCDSESVSVLFSLHCAKHLNLQVGYLVKIHPPWQCLTLESISHQVVMCAHFCQVSEATPLSGINQFLSPDKFPCSSSPMLSKSPVKGMFPTRLFGKPRPLDSQVVSEVDLQTGSAHSGLAEAIQHAKRGNIELLTATVKRVFMRRTNESPVGENRAAARWSLLVEDRKKMFVEIQCPLFISKSTSWWELVRKGEGKMVTFTHLKIIEKASFSRCPDLLSLVSSLCRCQPTTARMQTPPTSCFRLKCDVYSHAQILDSDDEEIPDIRGLDEFCGCIESGVEDGRVSVLARIVCCCREVADVPGTTAYGHYLFVVTGLSCASHHHFLKHDKIRLLKVYLKHSTVVSDLVDVLSSPGAIVYLRDLRYKYKEDSPSFILDNCSLVIPTCEEWNSTNSTKVYPVVKVKENEVMELRHAPMPRLPILSTVHCLPNNLVSVEGNIVGVDEANAFSWPICDACHSDKLTEDAQSSSTLCCENCNRVTSSPDVHVDLCVFLQCSNLNTIEVSVELAQSTIRKLLPITAACVDQEFEVGCVLNKHISLPSCYIVDSRETSLSGGNSVLVLKEINAS